MNGISKFQHPARLRCEKHLLAVLLLFPPLAARSGGVVTNCTEANLRAAMSGGGLVTFACDGTITLASTVTNMTDTVLDASGHQITISGGKVVRVFWVSTNTSLALLNLTTADGRSDSGAGIYNAGGQLALQNCTLVNNAATGPAGANYSGNPGTNGCGGAVYNRGVLNGINCTFIPIPWSVELAQWALGPAVSAARAGMVTVGPSGTMAP